MNKPRKQKKTYVRIKTLGGKIALVQHDVISKFAILGASKVSITTRGGQTFKGYMT